MGRILTEAQAVALLLETFPGGVRRNTRPNNQRDLMTEARTLCCCCDRLLALGAGEELAPGDLTVCNQCGAILTISADLGTKAPSEERLALEPAVPELRERSIGMLRGADVMRERRNDHPARLKRIRYRRPR